MLAGYGSLRTPAAVRPADHGAPGRRLPARSRSAALCFAEAIRDTERHQAEQIRAGVSLRSQLRFDRYLALRQQAPAPTFRDHLRAIGGAIEK